MTRRARLGMTVSVSVISVVSVVFATYLAVTEGNAFHVILAPVLAATLTYTNTRSWQLLRQLNRLDQQYETLRDS